MISGGRTRSVPSVRLGAGNSAEPGISVASWSIAGASVGYGVGWGVGK